MLLYQNDLYEQGACLHTTTQNVSFRRMHYLLEKMGVKNNLFFLGLHNKELKKITVRTCTDPSPELASMIAAECAINVWYYLREVILVPGQGGPVSFILNRANLMLAWCFYNNIDVFLTEPRQTGKTVSTVSIFSHPMFFMCKNFAITLLTKEHDNRLDNLSCMKQIRDYLPRYLVDLNSAKDKDNERLLTYAALGNKYKAKVGRPDYAGADNLGRGDTTPVNHLDECPYIRNFGVTYPVLMGTTIEAARQAKEAGLPYTNILTTTAGRLDNPNGKFVKRMIDSCMLFKEVLYDCVDRNELWNLLQKNSTNNMIYGVYSFLQLGKTHEWFKESVLKKIDASNDPTLIDRDYFNIWTSGSDAGLLSAELIKKVKASEQETVVSEIIDGYIFNWYEAPDTLFNSKYSKRNVVIGLDTSENIGKDFTSLCMLDASDMSVLCTARCNDADLIKLGLWIAKFLGDHTGTILIPERKSTASMLISVICLELSKRGINPFTKIYNQVFQRREERQFQLIDTNSQESIEGVAKKYLGFVTAGAGMNAREVLYKSTLQRAIRANHSRIRDTTLISELSGLTIKNGRVDHATSGHDDTVVAYLLACYFIYFGKNLDLYDCDSSLFLDKVTTTGSQIDPRYKDSQQQIYFRIQELKKRIADNMNPRLDRMLTVELMHLQESIDKEVFDLEPISMEQLKLKSNPDANLTNNKQYIEALFTANFGYTH